MTYSRNLWEYVRESRSSFPTPLRLLLPPIGIKLIKLTYKSKQLVSWDTLALWRKPNSMSFSSNSRLKCSTRSSFSDSAFITVFKSNFILTYLLFQRASAQVIVDTLRLNMKRSLHLLIILALEGAQLFVQRADHSTQLRSLCYSFSTRAEWKEILLSYLFRFRFAWTLLFAFGCIRQHHLLHLRSQIPKSAILWVTITKRNNKKEDEWSNTYGLY